jgi:ribosome-associated protein
VARDVPIRGDMIRLGQLLKLAGVVEGGGEIRTFLAETTVLVNDEPEARRGRQLGLGDRVRVDELELRVTRAKRTDQRH